MRAKMVIVVVVVCFLAGCSYHAEVPVGGDTVGWADDFVRLRQQAKTELERLVLADDRISDEERVASEDEFVKCAKKIGFVVTDMQLGGGYAIDGEFTEDDPPALAECQGSFDRISGQYWQMQRNPSGEDEAQLMIACLVRAGVIDRSFSIDDYTKGLGKPPLALGSNGFSQCNSEPLTAFIK